MIEVRLSDCVHKNSSRTKREIVVERWLGKIIVQIILDKVQENRANHKCKKGIAMTDCLVTLYPALRQCIVAILFVFMVRSVFSACSPSLVYLGPYEH